MHSRFQLPLTAAVHLISCMRLSALAQPVTPTPLTAPVPDADATRAPTDLTLVGSAVQAARTFEVGDGVKVSTRVLPNGLNVIIAKNPRAPLVSVYHWVKAGSLHEKPGTTGMAHLFEHMMFRPLAPGKPGFFELTQKLGAQANANTRFESTLYTSTVTRRNLDALLEAEADRFRNLKVTDELLSVERKAVWSEYSTKFDANPSFDVWYELYKRAYPGHPFGWMIIGLREDLEKIKAGDCNDFFQKNYRPNNVGLVISGDVDEAATFATVERLYGSWEKGTPTPLPPAFAAKTKRVRATSKLPAGGKQILAGWRLPYFTSKNALTFEFVNHVLFDSGNDLAGRRFVDKEKVASSIGSFSFDYGNGMLSGYVSALPRVKDDVIIKQFDALVGDLTALTDVQIKAYAKEFQVGMAEGLERNEAIASGLAVAWGKYGDETLLSTWSRTPTSFSRADLKAFARAYLRKENFVSISTPTGEATIPAKGAVQ